MAIVAAEVESSGWVLALTLDGAAAGGFADYVLDPDGSPRVVLNCSHAGFVQSGGQAVAGTMARAIPATIPLRLPVNPAAPTPAVIDEADLGGGLRRVRLALANHVYATDTGLTLNVLAGWRTGEGGATGIAVTNSSTLAAPMPIFRWADYQLKIVEGTFRLSLIVASHHPVGLRPVAGVRFTVTDGTTTRVHWATELGTDNSYGDNLRCYTVEVDPATATALTAGLLRCDAEVYPWLGAMRSTDPAGTRVMTGLNMAARSTTAATPYVVGYDPGAARYGNQWVVLDPVNGTATAAAGMVQTTLALAKAVAPASRARNLHTALQALWLANRTLPAANGGTSITRSCDGARIVLLPGVDNEVGATAVSTGLQALEVPVRVIGDPDNANPRANCWIRTNNNTTNPSDSRAGQFHFENCEVRFGQSRMLTSPFWMTFSNCEVVAKATFEASASMLTGGTPAAGRYLMAAVNTRWWRNGQGMNTANHRFGLIRACEHSRGASAFTYLKNRWIGPDDSTVGPATAFTTFNINTDLGGCEDVFIAYNDWRRMRTRAVNFTLPSGATAGTTYASQRRHVLLGNVLELISPTGSQPFMSIGEGQAVTASYNVVDNNMFVGERVNIWYNDPSSGSNTINSELFCNRMANNAFDRNATKHDDFLDGTFGYRPWLTGGWSAQCGVMHEGNWDGGRAAGNINTFRYWFRGLRSLQTNVETAPGVVDDRSRFGTNTGGGDYRPAAGSPLLGRVLNSNTDRDFNNLARAAGSPAGAYEAQPSGLMLAPVPGLHGLASSAAGLVTSVGLVPAGARHGHLAGSALLLAGAGLTPDAGVLPGRASTSALLLSVAVAPAPALHLLTCAAPVLATGGLVLAPGPGRHGLLDTGSLLSVPAVTLGARVLRVGPDLRTALVRQG